jgi:hypothetical protein
VRLRSVGGGDDDSDEDDENDDEDEFAPVNRCTANFLSMSGIRWMLKVDESLRRAVGEIGGGAFLTADGRLSKSRIYATLHTAQAVREIAKTTADGAHINGGVCFFAKAIKDDMSAAGEGAPNTRTACVESWEGTAASAIATRVDACALACLPVLRRRMSANELDDTRLVLVTSVTTTKEQLALSIPLADVIPPKPSAYAPRLAADATGKRVQGFLSSMFAKLADEFDCPALRKAIPLVVTEELSAHVTETALNTNGIGRGVVTTGYLWSAAEGRPFFCLTPEMCTELESFGLAVPHLAPAAPIQGAPRRPGRHALPEPEEPTTFLEKLIFNRTLAELSGVKEPYTAEEARTLVAEMDGAIQAAKGAARPRCPLPLC